MYSTLKNRCSRLVQQLREGPLEFEASIDEITRSLWGDGSPLYKFEPTYTLGFGEGVNIPSYLSYIYLDRSNPCAEEISQLFQKGHNIRIKGQSRAVWDVACVLLLEPLALRELYDAQIVIENKNSGEIMKEYDVRFRYLYPYTLDFGLFGDSLPDNLLIAAICPAGMIKPL